MKIRDEFTRGFVSGAAAGVITSIFNNLMVRALKFGNLRFVDFAAIMIYGNRPHGLPEEWFARLGLYVFEGLLGVFFIYLLDKIGKRNYWFKVSIFGGTIWFTIYAITLLFKIPELLHVSLATAAENLIASTIYSLFLGVLIRYLDSGVRERKSAR